MNQISSEGSTPIEEPPGIPTKHQHQHLIFLPLNYVNSDFIGGFLRANHCYISLYCYDLLLPPTAPANRLYNSTAAWLTSTRLEETFKADLLSPKNMSPTSSPKNSAFLGESWVVASSLLSKDQNSHPPADENKQQSEMTASASSMSGPELIMPSIYEIPISEASWVAPNTRSKGQSSPRALRRRQNKLPSKTLVKESRKTTDQDEQTTSKEETPQEGEKPVRTPNTFLVSFVRIAINSVLIALISHLLVLPELVYQYQGLCSINRISTFYPTSCVPPHPQPRTHSPSRHETVMSSQAQLESLFNETLQEMKPLTSTLKHSESMLHDMQRELKKAYPGTKHELDLEFEGCWQAIRTATTKFDTLNADIQSAVDSLLATGVLNSKGAQSSWPSQSEVAKDARFSTQILRRKQYLDQLTSRMRSKTDALSADLTSLDDHLESIENIVARERRQPIPNLSFSDYLPSFLTDLPGIGLFFQRPTAPPPSPEQSMLQRFQAAVSHHRSVTRTVRNLSFRLRTLQGLKGV